MNFSQTTVYSSVCYSLSNISRPGQPTMFKQAVGSTLLEQEINAEVTNCQICKYMMVQIYTRYTRKLVGIVF